MPKPARITGIEAQLFVADIDAACTFYSAQLGFRVSFVHGDPPFFAQVVRGRARLNLRAVDEPVFASGIREREHLLSASLTLATAADIKQLFAEVESADVRFHQRLRVEPWGAQTFVIADIDGNLILFAGPAGE